MEYLPIIISALIPMILGYFWYSPKGLGTIWMKEAGMTKEKVNSTNMIVILLLAFVFALIAAFILKGFSTHDSMIKGALYYVTDGTMEPDEGTKAADWLSYYQTELADDNHRFSHGAAHGLIFGFLLLPIIGTIALYESKTWKYILIHWAYWLISFVIMGGVLAAWQ